LWPVNRAALPPEDIRRVEEYVLKAAREAKRHTSWTEPDHAYEGALRSFIGRISHEQLFQDEMGRFARAIAPAAVSSSLALTILKVCTPGTPDFFQGTELFEATLTDPDNRRMVDFESRDALLSSLPAMDAEASDLAPRVEEMLANWTDGRIKLHVIRSLLYLRRDLAALFTDGSYVPLVASGSRADNLVSWSLRRGSDEVIAVVPRLTLKHAGRGRFPTGPRVWDETAFLLPQGAPRRYVNIFTGRTVATTPGNSVGVAGAFDLLPVAVLRRTE
jgi:(1->4)-alpha-D-glucan 1-alpha-D-glucosylmutase